MRGRLGYPTCGWETCYWIAHGRCIRGKEDTCPELEWRKEKKKGLNIDHSVKTNVKTLTSVHTIMGYFEV